MKNQNIVFIAIAFALAFVLAPVTKASPRPEGGPTHPPPNESANSAYSTSPEGENLPVVTIHSTGNILRGKTGSFVLDMKPVLMFGATFVKFSVSGTAVAGVDYAPLISPAYIGQSGYGTILVQALPDPRAFNRQAYSVVVTLEPDLGYFIGEPKSALIWIKSAQ